MAPCNVCAMLLIAAGITKVVAMRRYHAGMDAEKMLREAGVEVEVMRNDVAEYADQEVQPLGYDCR